MGRFLTWMNVNFEPKVSLESGHNNDFFLSYSRTLQWLTLEVRALDELCIRFKMNRDIMVDQLKATQASMPNGSRVVDTAIWTFTLLPLILAARVLLSEGPLATHGALYLLGFLTAALTLFVFSLVSRGKRIAQLLEQPMYSSEIEVRVSVSGIKFSASNQTCNYDWKAISGVRETKNGLAIFVGTLAIAIPKDCWPGGYDFEKLRDLLLEYGMVSA